jgi:lysophospholipase L1-like esterase
MSAQPINAMKKAIFYGLTFAPLALIAAGAAYITLFTNLLPLLNLQSVRNIYFECMVFVPEPYVYRMRPGECRFNNIEYRTVMHHDADGFRNPPGLASYDAVAIGDSHTQGWGVGDDETFSALLRTQFGVTTRNLGIASYATARELDVLRRYGDGAKYVILQYCNNDAGENIVSLQLNREDFRLAVERTWRGIVNDYNEGKAEGYKKPLKDLAIMLANRSFEPLSTWRSAGINARNMEEEASAFAQLIARERELLRDKRLIVFEAADFGMMSPRLAQLFTAALAKIDWLNFRVVDSTQVLTIDDYYFLDGHPRPQGHRKIAAALAQQIQQWEAISPVIAPMR